MHSRNLFFWLTVCLVATGAVLRLVDLGRYPLWLDEIYTVRLATNPVGFPTIWANSAKEIHPPLYYFLMRAILNFLPLTEFTARYVSAMAGILAPAALARYLLDARLRPGIVLTSVFLLVFSPFHLYHSQEARSYALSMSLLVIVAFIFRRAMMTGRPRYWVLHTVLWILLSYIHYFSLMLLAAEVIYIATGIFPKCSLRPRVLPFLISLAIIAALFSPLMPLLAGVIKNSPPTGRTLQTLTAWASLKTIVGGDYRYACPVYSAAGAVFLSGLLFLGAWQALHKKDLVLDLMAVVLPAFALLILLPAAGKTVPPYQERQFIATLPFILTLALSGATALWEKPAIWSKTLAFGSICGLVLAGVCGTWHYYTSHPKKHDLDLIQYLRLTAQPGDLILCNTYSAEATLDVYGGDLGLVYWGKPHLTDGQWRFSSRIGFVFGEEVHRDKTWADLESWNRLWLVYLPGQGPASLVEELTRQWVLVHQEKIGPFQVYLLQNPLSDSPR